MKTLFGQIVVSDRKKRLVLIVAGEASADSHGSKLVWAMNGLNPEIAFSGIGGEKMGEAGVRILFSSSDMAVVGLTEIFSRLPLIVRAYRNLNLFLKSAHPDLLILIDYPGFNISFARCAKRLNIPVLYYISPQVWAWRRGRIDKIAKRVDRMAVILPFEREVYRKRGLDADYVGHPLMDGIPRGLDKNEVIDELGLTGGNPILGLLPGSRREEIRNHLPQMIEAAERLSSTKPGIKCILPLAPTISPDLIQTAVKQSRVEIKVFRGDIYKALIACDLAFVTSGTATLETAIMGIPMVVGYRMSPISFWVGKKVVDVPFISLVNLVADEEVVPELIQDDFTPQKLAQEASSILNGGTRRNIMIEKLMQVKKRLGIGGAAENTAKLAVELMRQP